MSKTLLLKTSVTAPAMKPSDLPCSFLLSAIFPSLEMGFLHTLQRQDAVKEKTNHLVQITGLKACRYWDRFLHATLCVPQAFNAFYVGHLWNSNCNVDIHCDLKPIEKIILQITDKGRVSKSEHWLILGFSAFTFPLAQQKPSDLITQT